MNSASLPPPVSLDAVTEFLDSKSKSFDVPGERARQNIMAIHQLAALRTPDEPSSVEWAKANIDTLVERFARKNSNLRGDTARTYGSRMRTSIEEWERFNQNPAAYKWKAGKEPVARGPRAKLKVVPEPETFTAPSANTSPNTPEPTRQPTTNTVANDTTLQTFRLPDGRVFRFEPMGEGFTMADAHRIAWHLATMTEDFDPGAVRGLSTAIVPQR